MSAVRPSSIRRRKSLQEPSHAQARTQACSRAHRARPCRLRQRRSQFSNVYFFGDSYTDMGSYKPVLPPGTGMFTTNPGPVWAQPFAQYFGFSRRPANQGGNDYAYGGARVTLLPGYPPVPPTSGAVPIATQIQQLIGQRSARPECDLFRLGWRERFLHPVLRFSIGQDHVGRSAGQPGTAAVPTRAADRGAARRRCAIHPRLELPGCQQAAGVCRESGDRPDKRGRLSLLHHVLRRAQRLRDPDDPGQRAGARERDRGQPGRLRVHERNDTCVPARPRRWFARPPISWRRMRRRRTSSPTASTRRRRATRSLRRRRSR